jgi:uncharacterized protein (TIGR03435 family)
MACASIACAQNSFEVASVKPAQENSAGCSGGPGTTDPGLWRCGNVSLASLISLAYNLRTTAMVGLNVPFHVLLRDWMPNCYRESWPLPAHVASITTRSELRPPVAEPDRNAPARSAA